VAPEDIVDARGSFFHTHSQRAMPIYASQLDPHAEPTSRASSTSRSCTVEIGGGDGNAAGDVEV